MTLQTLFKLLGAPVILLITILLVSLGLLGIFFLLSLMTTDVVAGCAVALASILAIKLEAL